MRLHEIRENAYKRVSDYLSPEQFGIILDKYRPTIDQYLKNGNYIYRGMDNTADIIFGDGNKLNRKSANTTNYYTMILDNLPNWKQYPKRSKSFIGTTNYAKAHRYGTVYVIIPLENQPIGICPEEDLWFSFDKSIVEWKLPLRSLGDFNDFLTLMFESAGYRKVSDTNWDDFREVFSDLEYKYEDIIEDSDDYKLKHFVEIFQRFGINFFKEFFNPEKNGFVLTNQNNLPSGGNQEVWLSGKVLFVDYGSFEDYLKNAKS